MPSPVLQQIYFRGIRLSAPLNDSTAPSFIAAQDIDFDFLPDQLLRLRFTIDETNNVTGTFVTDGEGLFYRKNGGTWTAVTSSSSNVQLADSHEIDDPATTEWDNVCNTRLLGIAPSGAFETDGPAFDRNEALAAKAYDKQGYFEVEVALKIVDADVSAGDTLEFLFRNGNIDTTEGNHTIPTVTVRKPSITQRYANTASTAGGDGTTNAESGANRAYASLNEWEANEDDNLVTTTVQHRVDCSCGTGSAADTTAVTLGGWTMNHVYYAIIRANPTDSQEATLPFPTTTYRLAGTSGSNRINVQAGAGFVRFEGLAIQVEAPAFPQARNGISISTGDSGEVYVIRCVFLGIMDASDTSQCSAINVLNNDVVIAQDCWAVDFEDVGSSTNVFFRANVGIGHLAIHCAAINCAEAFEPVGSTDAIRAINCFYDGRSQTSKTFAAGAGSMAGSDYNASSESTSPPGGTVWTSQTFTYVDAGGGDFHLASNDAGAVDRALDFSAIDLALTTDIDGDTRGASPDLGPDEYFSTGQTVNLGAPSITWTAPNVTPAPGAVTEALSAAVLSWTAPNVASAPGVVSVPLTPATAAWTAPSVTLVPGAVTTPLTAAVTSWMAPDVTPTPGAISVQLTAAVAIWGVPDVTPALVTLVSLTPATATWTAPDVTPLPGAATIAITAAAATWTATDVLPVPGAVSAPLTAAIASWSAPDVTPSVGGQTIPLDPATATWSVPNVIVTSGGVTIPLSAAAATWTAPDVTATPGAVTIQMMAAIGAWTVPDVSPAAGTQAVNLTPAFTSWAAPDTTAVPGVLTIVLTPAVATWAAAAAVPSRAFFLVPPFYARGPSGITHAIGASGAARATGDAGVVSTEP